MTAREKLYFLTQVRYELKVAKTKVRNLEYIISLLEDKENQNETRTSRNKTKYVR